MIPVFFKRHTLWCPTPLGWASLLVVAAAPFLLWWFKGEDFLSRPERKPAEVLVVEGWIGVDGMRAAKAEFESGGYSRIVTSGGLSKDRSWDRQQWNFPELARTELIRLGIPPDRVIAVKAREVVNQRTFESAVAVRHVLHAEGMHPSAVNVFTLGAHARRSRLVFAKVLGPETPVGVVSWTPPADQSGPWWTSSERAEVLIKETVGWPFEVLLNSGRTTNSPATP